MSLLKAIKAQLGLSNTPANNFTITAEADNGTLKLARGNAGATTQDILTVDVNGKVSAPQGISSTENLPAFQCRAWVNFDATRNSSGGTDSANTNRFIRASGNVTSVLRNGAGDYTVTFTTALPDVNYAATAQAGSPGALATHGAESTLGKTYNIGSYRFVLVRADSTALDRTNISVSVFR